DPVAAGLVTSLNQPGGNATGFTNFSSDLGPKKLELLHEVAPTAKTVALLANPNNRVLREGEFGGVQTAAKRLGLETIAVECSTENEIETAFAFLERQGAGAVYLGSDLFLLSQRQLIAALALRHKLPTVSPWREAIRAGQLISYGADDLEIYRPARLPSPPLPQAPKPPHPPLPAPP